MNMPHQDNANPTHEPIASSRGRRWVKYGSNVVVFIVAVVAIVVLVNSLMVWSLKDQGNEVRFDLTATRKYSLSPQSQRVLADLDRDLNIVLLYAAGSEQAGRMSRVEDLLAEYAGRSGRVNVRRIDPVADPVAFDVLMKDLIARFGDATSRARLTLEDASKTLASLRTFAAQQTIRLRDLRVRLDGLDPTIVASVTEVLPQQLQSIAGEFTETAEHLDAGLADPLPNYNGLALDVRSILERFNTAYFSPIIARLKGFADTPGAPDAAKDALLGLVREYEPERDRTKATLEKLAALDTAGYDTLRSKVSRSNAVVIYVDQPAASDDPAARESGSDAQQKGVTALSLVEIYPTRVSETEDGEMALDVSYQGEEAITGAILELTFRHKTKLVLVSAQPRPVIGPGAPPQIALNYVAERLRRMNFEVEEWNPTGGIGPGGQPRQPMPRPVAEPGQKLVYVVLPPPASQSPIPNPAVQAVNSAVTDYLADGGAAMIVTGPSVNALPTDQGPLGAWLEPFGLTVDPSKVILMQYPGRGGNIVASNQFPIESYPTAHAIGRAMPGLRGIAVAAAPISLPASPPAGVEILSLMQSPADTWAEDDTSNLERAAPGDNEKTGPIDIAVAASRKIGDHTQRIVLISDPIWPTDAVATAGAPLAIQFPANSELTVNSICWLAGLDPLIGQGARSQDVRRIGNVTAATRSATWWMLLAGVPALCLGIGAAVWFTRRG